MDFTPVSFAPTASAKSNSVGLHNLSSARSSGEKSKYDGIYKETNESDSNPSYFTADESELENINPSALQVLERRLDMTGGPLGARESLNELRKE